MKIKITHLYGLLLEAYGPQKWWPVTPEGAITPVYSGGPTNDQQRLEVAVGAILTQNTSWKNVELALQALNKGYLIDISALSSCLLYTSPSPRDCQ